MEELRFSYNWNRKLYCRCFTSIRLRNDKRFFAGAEFKGFNDQEKKYIGIIKVLDLKVLKLNQINEYIARLDTGYNAEECKGILRKMYKNSNIEIEKEDLVLLLLMREDI
jgi:hypothetical protein